MALLSQLPTHFLALSLALNPDTQTFPWSLTSGTGLASRSAVLTELQNRADIPDNVLINPPPSVAQKAVSFTPPSLHGKTTIV